MSFLSETVFLFKRVVLYLPVCYCHIIACFLGIFSHIVSGNGPLLTNCNIGEKGTLLLWANTAEIARAIASKLFVLTHWFLRLRLIYQDFTV
jgi:hypothetical protein